MTQLQELNKSLEEAGITRDDIWPENWDKGGRVHNWRTYIGEHTRRILE